MVIIIKKNNYFVEKYINRNDILDIFSNFFINFKTQQ